MSSVFPITDDPRYRRITASAGQTVFSIGFPFLQNEDIGIYLQTAPSQYTLFNPSAYTLTGANNPAGGSATFLAPRNAGDIILILGAAVLDRMSSIVRDGKFSSALTDGELDRIRIIQQEFSRDAERAIKVDYGGEGVTLASNLTDGDVLMKDGARLVPGPKAEDIANAQGYAEAAKASENAAAGSAETATSKASSASSSATLAGRWASAPEDEEVVPTTGLFSAFHWYRKTLAIWNNVIAGWSGAVHNAPLKASPSLADEFGFADSGDSWKIKKQTFAKLQEVFGVPIGTTIMVQGNGNTPPPGFLLHNGAAVTAAYPQLRAWLLANGANVNGNGDPIIEDMGGYFPRGWRPGQVVDSARVFGSTQQDAMQGHKHRTTGGSSDPAAAWANLDGQENFNTQAGAFQGIGSYFRTLTGGPLTDGANGAPRTATETRPVNKTFTYWIKAYAADQVPGSIDFAALANNVQALQTMVNASGLKLGAKVAPANTGVLYLGIPAGIAKFTLHLRNVVWNAQATPILKLGTSAALVSSGYRHMLSLMQTNVGYSTTPFTADIRLAGTINTTLNGDVTFYRVPGTNDWQYSGQMSFDGGSAEQGSWFEGGVILPAELDRVQVTSLAGTAIMSGTAIWADWEFAA